MAYLVTTVTDQKDRIRSLELGQDRINNQVDTLEESRVKNTTEIAELYVKVDAGFSDYDAQIENLFDKISTIETKMLLMDGSGGGGGGGNLTQLERMMDRLREELNNKMDAKMDKINEMMIAFQKQQE